MEYPPRKPQVVARTSKPRYDGIADWYDQSFAHYGDLTDPLSSYSHLARLLGPGGGACLDVACGGGLHHEAITYTGRRIVGMDVSADQLRIAQKRGLAVLVRASATALPFDDGSFPTIVCTYLHTDIDNMAPALAEMRRVLQLDGRLVYLGVHPCFWGHFIENPGGPGRIVHPGYLNTGWVDSPFWRDSSGLRAKVGARHATVSEIVNAFIAAGLLLDGMEELLGGTGHADRIAIVARQAAAG